MALQSLTSRGFCEDFSSLVKKHDLSVLIDRHDSILEIAEDLLP
jgi:hypothetical protein